jgi:Ran GTPase-activating protein (RanGAP) involved in mRNA processing and transport
LDLHIYFTGNSIGDDGMTAISKALEVNKKIRDVGIILILDIWRNPIFERGAKQLANVIEKSTTLENLSNKMI